MRQTEFIRLVLENPINKSILDRLQETGLPDAWLVSGCLFQTIWNHNTGRCLDHEIKDYDLFYFDGSDLSWEAEDAAIAGAIRAFADIDATIEIRNQARVHLWYEEKFGIPYAPLKRTTDGIDRFLAIACMVGIRPNAKAGFEVYAPKGLQDLSDMIVRPNALCHFDAESYQRKAARWRTVWPELCIYDL